MFIHQISLQLTDESINATIKTVGSNSPLILPSDCSQQDMAAQERAAFTHWAMTQVRKSNFLSPRKKKHKCWDLLLNLFLPFTHTYITRLYSILTRLYSSTTLKFFLQWGLFAVWISGQIKFAFLFSCGTKKTREPVPFCMYSLTLNHNVEVLQWNIFVPLPGYSRDANLCI